MDLMSIGVAAMDPFIHYLVVVNVAALVAYALDFVLCVLFEKLDGSLANAIVMDLFPVVGGALGSLLAMFVLTRLFGGRHMNKENVAWWFVIIVCLIIWGAIASVVLGLVDFRLVKLLAPWNETVLVAMALLFVVINVGTFITFKVDKAYAEQGKIEKRAPEARLLGLCLIGGSVGGMIAMRVERHKTKKWYFVYGLPFFLVLDVAAVLFAHGVGMI